MKFLLLLLMLGIASFFVKAQTETLTLHVGDKFEVLGLKGKLFEVYGPGINDDCNKSEYGKVVVASVAYVEFKYTSGGKVSTELCNQQVQMKETGEIKVFYTPQKFKAKDGIISLSLTKVSEGKKENLITLEISKEPLK